MKIILTQSEANTAIKDSMLLKFPHKTDLTIEIVPDNTTSVNPMHHLEAYASVVGQFGASLVNSGKIPAIKELRTLIPGLGLADAKHIVEAAHGEVLNFFNSHKSLHGFCAR